jgi:hypothetical protein
VEVDRLNQVRIETRIEGLLPVGVLAKSGQRNQSYRVAHREPTDPAGDLIPIDLGLADIDKCRVRPELLDRLQAFQTVFRSKHLTADCLQQPAGHHADIELVFNQ